MNKRQFVIFGGAGFVGRHLERFLIKQYPESIVHIADIRIEKEDACHHRVDVRHPIELPLEDLPTTFFNLAAVHKTPGHPDHDYFETNIRGAENVCDFARKQGVSQIVFTSSIAPYGAAEDLKTEEVLPTPNTPYGISKLVAEKIHQIWQAENSERQLSILRPGVVFGQGEGGNFTRLYKGLKRGLFAFPGRVDTLKAGIYVKDLVRIMVLMAEAPKQSMQLYNACFANPPRIDTIVREIQAVMGQKRRVMVVPAALLKMTAFLFSFLGFLGLGFHPDRVEKLMRSTNVSGKKLSEDFPLEFDLGLALKDWFQDNHGKGLY